MRTAKLLVGAVVAGSLCTWIMRRIAMRFGIVSMPNPIVRDHVKPAPYLGGLGVLFGSAIPLLALFGVMPSSQPQLCAFVAFSLLGLVDDLFPLSPLLKLALQFLLASVFVWLSYMSAPSRMGAPTTAWIGMVLASVWLVTVVNALNFIDVCDGLAASVAAVILLCWGCLAPSSPSALYVAVGGACLGFLVWNKPPARIYLGDSGSHGLGFLVGAAALDGFSVMPGGAMRVAAVMLCTGVPLFELVFITAVRIRKGLPWWKGSPDHFALRLIRAGFSKTAIDLLASVLSALLWFAGMALVRMPSLLAFLLLAMLLTGIAVCWRLLLLWEA